MKKKNNKLLSWILVLAMLMTILPMSVFADESDTRVAFRIGGVALVDSSVAVSKGVLAYYQNDGTVTTSEPTSWNAKLEYSTADGFTLTLNNLQASGDTGSLHYTACAIYVNSYNSNYNEPLTIILNGTNTLNANSGALGGIYANAGNLTITGTGSLNINNSGDYGIYTWSNYGQSLSIEGGEISFSGSTGSCNSSIESVSAYENASVLVGDSADTTTTWDGTTHWSNYKYVAISEAETINVDFRIGGVKLVDSTAAVSEGVLAYYQNGGTVTTTEPTTWNAKLEYSVTNGFTLSLNNLSASSGTANSSINTRSGIFMDTYVPLKIIVEGTNELNVDVNGCGIYANSKSLTISGAGSLKISGNPFYGINVYNNEGSSVLIESCEISFSGWRGSCISETPISVYENASVLVGDDANTATTWDGTTHWTNYKYVSVSEPPEAKWGSSASEITNSGTLEEALSSDAAYIQLQENATLTSAVKVANGETLTFDLNGKSLTAESGIDSFSNSGTLNILSSSTEKGIIINNNSGNCGIYNNGTLTMKNVSVTGGNPLNNNSGTAVIENCNFINEGNSYFYCAIRNSTDCYLELSNCSLIGIEYGLKNFGTVEIKSAADISGENYYDIYSAAGTLLDISGVTNIAEEWNLYLVKDIVIKLPSGYSLYDSDGLRVENFDEIEYDVYTINITETAILSYDSDTKTATVVVEEAGKYSLIFTDYGEGNRLQNVDIVEFDFEAGVNTVPQDITTFTLGTGDKIMLWSNMTNIVPLCNTLIIVE